MRKIKRTRAKRGGGGCFGAFCSTNNPVKNVINVSKMNIHTLHSKIAALMFPIKMKLIELGQASDPKQKATLEKEISQLNQEKKLYEDEIAKQSRSMKESIDNSVAITEKVHRTIAHGNPPMSSKDFFAKSPQKPGVISGGGCARQS